MEENKKELRPVRSVGFWEAVRLAYAQYATFSGRATRKEHIYFCLFNLAVSGIFQLLTALGLPLVHVIDTVYGYATLIPGIALSVRRLHDGGYSGWSWFWILVPIAGPIILLLLIYWSSDDDNKYGPRKVQETEVA